MDANVVRAMVVIDRLREAFKLLSDVATTAIRGARLLAKDAEAFLEERRRRERRKRELLAIMNAIAGARTSEEAHRVAREHRIRAAVRRGLEVQLMLKDVPIESMPTPEMVSSMAHQLGLRLQSVSIVGDEGRVSVVVAKGSEPTMVLERCAELGRQLALLATERVDFDVVPRFDGAPEA